MILHDSSLNFQVYDSGQIAIPILDSEYMIIVQF